MTNEEIDPEIAAMGSISGAMSKLDSEQQVRVLRWAADRWGVKGLKFGGELPKDEVETDDDSRGSGSGGAPATYGSIDELFESGVAKTNTQKALLAAYWFQVIQANAGFQSFTLNTALKDLGIGIPNITDALGTAEAQKPALVMQTSKTGKSRQARKTYKLTTAGVKAVEAILNGHAE
jgi:hypothetical protein